MTAITKSNPYPHYTAGDKLQVSEHGGDWKDFDTITTPDAARQAIKMCNQKGTRVFRVVGADGAVKLGAANTETVAKGKSSTKPKSAASKPTAKPATAKTTAKTAAANARAAKAMAAKPAEQSEPEDAKEPAQPAAKPAATPKKLSALDAATKVLADSGTAMNCQELVTAMRDGRLWTSPGGKTPSATLHAAISTEIRKKGAASRFAKAERGKFKLNGAGEKATGTETQEAAA
jgi:hypothetical protein